MKIFFFVLKCLVVLVLVTLVACIWRTWQVKESSNQTIFLEGKAPSPAPDGFYDGTAPGYDGVWLGKKFDAAHSTGTNIFGSASGTKTERYAFVTSSRKGLQEKNLDVLAIDYNIPGNPFWLRPVLDEIVQIAPNHYVGKLQVRLIPRYPFTFTFFELKR